MPSPKKKAMPRGPLYVYEPNSLDAQFSSLHTSLQNHFDDDTRRFGEQKVLLEEILSEAKVTNGRVTKIEGTWKWGIGWIAGATAVASIVFSVLKLWH